MGHRDYRHHPARVLLAICTTALAFFVFVPQAQAASFEEVGCFAGHFPGLTESCKPVPEAELKKAGFEFGEEVQLSGVGGLAVNRTGAGGVPKGTVYAATRGEPSGTLRIAEYRPQAGGGLEFALRWEVNPVEGPYERCGPQAEEPLHPHCSPQAERVTGDVDVDVDQATGNVYVFSVGGVSAGGTSVAEFDPNGKAVIARFAKLAPSGVTTAATPGEVHSSPGAGGMAVNDAGEVYVFDLGSPNFYHRLMVFKPKVPGVYSEYEYAGEIAAGFLFENEYPTHPVFDDAGHLYTATEETIEELAPQEPGPYPAGHLAPACGFEFAKAGITAMTVNPITGEPFFVSYKKEKGFTHKLLRQLGPCEEGKFKETAKAEILPERDDIFALAFDPGRTLEAGRPAGVLYGAAPGSAPSIGVGEPGQASLGYVFAQPKSLESPPKVEAESVAKVTSSTAQLQAQVDPEGFPTTYRFQYLTEAEYEAAGEGFAGAKEAPPGGAPAGTGKAPVAVAVGVSGLAPDTAYRYRAVAESECSPAEEGKVCVVPGEAQSFRTFPPLPPGLPDERTWELVSPAQKHGGEVLPAEPNVTSCIPVECKPGSPYTHFPMQSAPDGDSVLFEGTAFSPSEGAVIENSYVARRGPRSGWQTTNLTPPLLRSKGFRGYKVFTAGLGEGILEQVSPSLAPTAPAEYANLYRQPSGDPSALQPLIEEGNATLHCVPFNGQGSLKLAYAGASGDFSRQFFAANDALTPEATGACEETNLYEWSGGELRALNVLPGEAQSDPGAALGSGKLLGASYGSIQIPVLSGAISEDGSRVYWTAADGRLFAGLDGGESVEVPGPGNCSKAVPEASRVCFLSASADGSKVLLSDGHVYSLNGESGAYEETLDLTAGQGGFKGIVGQSEDLSHVYFVDSAVLAGENAAHQSPVAGQPNLYAGSEGTTGFVATLSAKDSQTWHAAPTLRMGEASPNGRYLTFLSIAPITGYDNVGPCESDHFGGYVDAPCSEAFLYDSASEELICASCNPTGEAPIGQTLLRLILRAPEAMGQPRYLTDSGRLYFDSRDSLVTGDTNDGAEDVYQYELAGTGSCERPEGCVDLISGGRESLDSNFLAIDETGANVFFTTRDRLGAKDKDELVDLYDAREGGGIPSESETQRGECQGEACQPPAIPPASPTPASAAFNGPGNEVKKPARKKKAKKHGHKRRHKRHRANAKRGAQR